MLELTLPSMTCPAIASVSSPRPSSRPTRRLGRDRLASHRARVEAAEDHEVIDAAIVEEGTCRADRQQSSARVPAYVAPYLPPTWS
jgi:hypothetical protein